MTVGYSKSKTHRNGNHRSLNDKPITIYGDVQRARYVLYVEDLAENFLPVQKDISAISGQVFVAYGPMIALASAPGVEQRFDATGATWTPDELSASLGGYFTERDPDRSFVAREFYSL